LAFAGISFRQKRFGSFFCKNAYPIGILWKNRVRWKDYLSKFARPPSRTIKMEDEIGKRAIWEKSSRY
jgi:hypothetical protein